ncbi:MAG: hypothetical protein GX610_06595 [Rhodococcus sp.]|nr:hypothetical protein [Rhodococcus sp. (in: high G+C Gram-positive bacteria)]
MNRTLIHTLTRWTAPAAVALAMAIGTPPLASAQPAHAAPVTMPYCEMLPMIMIYPPPPTTVQCHTPFGDFTFMLPPGTVWPF